MAASEQLLFAGVGLGVSGSGVSVRVGGIAVGTVKPGLVGGRVDVTKRTGAFVGEFSCETVTQAVRMNANRRKFEMLFLFIGLKYNANKKAAVPMDLEQQREFGSKAIYD